MFNFCNFYIILVKWNLNIYFVVYLLKIVNKILKLNLCIDFVLEKRSFIFRFIKILIGDFNV